jgi:DNA processing protein
MLLWIIVCRQKDILLLYSKIMISEFEAVVGFSHFLGIGPIRFSQLIDKFKSANKAYFANPKELNSVLGSAITNKFVQFRNEFDIKEKIKEIENKNIKIITRFDKKFPKIFLEIPDPPICIYVKGEINEYSFLENYIAVVGTRNSTSYGERVTKEITSQLVACNFIIVSGMALGIDKTAHESALISDGKTIAVLGCGVDIIYPQSNRDIYENILENKGLIISEFPPGHLVQKGLFVARNRLISALSKGVVIIEGSKDSGALITARYAAEQGKEVFALPGQITSQMSQAPNLLIKQGAKLITSVDDILEEFNMKKTGKISKKDFKNLKKEEKEIIKIIENEPKGVDDIVISSKKKVSEVLQILSSLEIKGYIFKNSEDKYEIN